MTNKEQALETIRELVNRFEEQLPTLKNSKYKEHNLRTEYLNPFWEALGWDVSNKQGKVQAYKEVEQEDTLKIENLRGAPDYCFRKNKDKRFFFLEAKKPIENIKDNIDHAQQTRTYGWCGNLNISILSDFEEFSLYDCTKKPKQTDTVRTARLEYMTYKEYEKNFDFLWDTFSRESVFNGSIDQFASKHIKRGKETVDKEFLISLDNWRTELAENISLRNKNHIDEDQLNFAVQHIIDRLIFLRIAEDRNIEPYGNLKNQLAGDNFYQNIQVVFAQANDRYNSGLFDPNKDQITATLTIDNKVIKDIVTDMYYPKSPYLFDVISVEILGSAYEQFLGKTITINNRGKAIIELKPEVRKAGGVYYTPQYIVDYIVENTVGKLLENKSPKEASEIKICDPACGSGSFLLGAYQYLLNWHKDYYLTNGDSFPFSEGVSARGGRGSKKSPLTPEGNLTTGEKKRILLNNIYGVDIDTNAVEVTKLSLLLKCMEGETQASIAHQMTMFNERVLPTLDDNIKSGNSLIDTDFYDGMIEFEERKIKPFNWQKAFPTVFKNGGFDVVIGNPPYGATFKENEKNYVALKYRVSEGNYESFSFFIEKSNHILKNNNGTLGFIIPDTWFTLKSSTKLRKFVLEEFEINTIQMLNENVFTSAKVDVCTFIISKNKSNNTIPFDVLIYDKDATDEEMKNRIFSFKNSFTKIELLQNNEFSFQFKQNKKTTSLVEKISKYTSKLEDYCLIGSGCKPYEVGKGSPPQTKEMLDDKIYTSKTKKNESYKLLIRGADISRYAVSNKNDEWLSYGEWLAAPRNPKLFIGDRLLFQSIRNPKLKRRLIGTFTNDNSVNNNSITNIILSDYNKSLKCFLGILNSNLINWYFSVSYNIVNIDPRYLKMIPIPNIQKKDEKEIENSVDQLLQLNKDLQAETLESKKEQIKRKIDHYEDKINELVYKLYDLTEEEIKIVEGG